MSDDGFEDACLVLVGHGATVNRDSSIPVWTLVAEFERRGCFGAVRAAFYKEAPLLPTALEGVTHSRVFVVPFFISEGYFSEEVVPEVLGFRVAGHADYPRVRRRGNQTLVYCRPVGTHANMTAVVLSRAHSVVEEHPFPRTPVERETSLFIAGHGTARNAESRQSVERQVELIRGQTSYALVQAVFMEESPRIEDCYTLAATRNIVVVPFFLSDGLHVTEDIPVLLGEPAPQVAERLAKGRPTWRNPTERRGKRVWYSAAVGTDPVVASVILDRVGEAALEADRSAPESSTTNKAGSMQQENRN